jgi:hypothetical protein
MNVFMSVGCHRQTLHTVLRQAKLSTIRPTLVRPQLPAVPAPRSQQMLLKIRQFRFGLSLLGFHSSGPMTYYHTVSYCYPLPSSRSSHLFYPFLSRIFHLHLSSLTLLLIVLMLCFLVSYPFRFLVFIWLWQDFSAIPVFAAVTYSL